MTNHMTTRKLTKEEREEINRNDLEKINAEIEFLTKQSQDLDEYQAAIDWESAESDDESNSQ